MKHVRSAFVLAGVGVGAVLAWYTGVLEAVWRADALWICTITVAVAALAFLMSFFDRRWLSYGLDVCPSLGFLGTVVGFILMLSALGASNDAWAMRAGLGIAVYTTAVGLVCALILYAQKIALETGGHV